VSDAVWTAVNTRLHPAEAPLLVEDAAP
jgi:hypothetical protein